MRTRVILLLSLGLNGLLAVLLWTGNLAQLPLSPTGHHASATNLFLHPTIKTNVVVRRQNFIWSDIESTDYRQFIANLRSIGCPETTIRDIITADVNALYEKKRATEVITGESQWWKSEPDPQVIEAAINKHIALDNERRALLKELLGTSTDSEPPIPGPPIPSTTTLVLDGPILGTLSAETRESLQTVEARAQSRRAALAESQRNGKKIQPEDLARLRQQTRDDLAKVLTPPQLEEYLLRYSQNASNMREELKGFQVTPDEFRGIFRARDQIDQQLALYGEDPASAKQRKELEDMREASIKQALGPDRYTLYQYTQDPLFRQAQASAEQIGAPPEKVLPLFQINQATQRELARIQGNTSLTVEEQTAALREVQANQLESIRKVLGPEAFEQYTKNSGTQ